MVGRDARGVHAAMGLVRLLVSAARGGRFTGRDASTTFRNTLILSVVNTTSWPSAMGRKPMPDIAVWLWILCAPAIVVMMMSARR
jgi:hypothetical protein